MFVQVEVALVFFHLALDATTDALVHIQDIDFTFKLREQVFQTGFHLRQVQHGLFVFQLQRQMRCDGVGQTASVVDAGNGGEDFGRNFFVEFHVLVKLLHDRTAQGFHLGVLLGCGRQGDRGEVATEVRRAVFDAIHRGALLALD